MIFGFCIKCGEEIHSAIGDHCEGCELEKIDFELEDEIKKLKNKFDKHLQKFNSFYRVKLHEGNIDVFNLGIAAAWHFFEQNIRDSHKKSLEMLDIVSNMYQESDTRPCTSQEKIFLDELKSMYIGSNATEEKGVYDFEHKEDGCIIRFRQGHFAADLSLIFKKPEKTPSI